VTPRRAVEAQFRADWATIPALSRARVVATERPLDEPTQLTALIRVKGVKPCPEAPLSHWNVDMVLALISGHLDADQAQDDLDEAAYAALLYLDATYPHGDAEFTEWAKARLACDIPFTVRVKKKDDDPDPESEAP